MTDLPIQNPEIDSLGRLVCRIVDMVHYPKMEEYTVNLVLTLPLYFAIKGYSLYSRIKMVFLVLIVLFLFHTMVAANDIYSHIYSNYRILAEKGIHVHAILPFDLHQERVHFWIRCYYMDCFRYILVIVLLTTSVWLFRRKEKTSLKNVSLNLQKPFNSQNSIFVNISILKMFKLFEGKIIFLSFVGILLSIFIYHYTVFMSRQVPLTAYKYMKQGIKAYDTRNYIHAEKYFIRAIDENPDYAFAHFHLGRLYNTLGRYKESISSFSRSIEYNPKTECFYNHRGVLFRKLGHFSQAINDFNFCINLNPRYSQAYNNRGVAFSKMGLLKRAIHEYTEAIGLNPRFLVAYINRGVAHEENGNYLNALQDYNSALEIDPKNAFVYQRRGNVVLLRFKDVQKACSDWKRACELGCCQNYDPAKAMELLGCK